jgi:hypothetical protein
MEINLTSIILLRIAINKKESNPHQKSKEIFYNPHSINSAHPFFRTSVPTLINFQLASMN